MITDQCLCVTLITFLVPSIAIMMTLKSNFHLIKRKVLESLNRSLSGHDEYVLVFLAAGMENRPDFSWLLKSYRTIDRKYKKALKQLYIVHASRWTKLFLSFMKNILSSKFIHKLSHVDSLAELTMLIPLKKIEIPQIVADYDSKKNGKNKSSPKFFAQPIEKFVFGDLLSPELERIFIYLEANGNTEGIFRISARASALQKMKLCLDSGKKLSLSEFTVFDVAGILKMFLRELKDPIFPIECIEKLNSLNVESEQNRIENVHEIVSRMPNGNLVLLRRLINLCQIIVKNQNTTLMKSSNLAIVLAPNLFRFHSLDEELTLMSKTQELVQFIIENPSSLNKI